MPRWPIRVKLTIGLSLVIAMMLTLLGGSIVGLRAFHRSNLTLTDQLRELGASKDLLQAVMQFQASMQLDRDDEALLGPGPRRDDLVFRLAQAREALARYHAELQRNSLRGHRTDGRDEFTLAILIDDDLTGILSFLDHGVAIDHLLSRTPGYLSRHPEQDPRNAGPWEPYALVRTRLDRLTASAAELPDKLHSDFYQVLDASKRHYQSCRVIVWTSALAVLAMLAALTKLVQRWVLVPIRLLHRGVRRVARGAFDSKITLDTGDEMQALAEAFNDMTRQLGATYADLERQIDERSRQLVRSERLAGVGFLAAGVAHEINNPLASIAFCSEALEGRLEPAPAPSTPTGPATGRSPATTCG